MAENEAFEAPLFACGRTDLLGPVVKLTLQRTVVRIYWF